MSVRDCYCAAEVEVPGNDAEAMWVEVSLRNKHKLFVGRYNRSPIGNASNQLDELEKKHCITSPIKRITIPIIL